MNGWIKLHRKTLKNPIFRHDKTAWHVFETLLIVVDHQTGQWDGGRYQLSGLCELKPTTTYKALKRLENAKMVTLKPNNRYTIISICKWFEYQVDNNIPSNIKVTSKEHQSNTLTRSKNKELKIPTNVGSDKVTTMVKENKSNPELNELLSYADTLGFVLQGTVKDNRYAAHNLLRKYGLTNAKRFVEAAVKARGQQYAPTINDFGQLYRRAGDLASFYSRQKTKQVPKL